jgi:prephenate dehydrogenase
MIGEHAARFRAGALITDVAGLKGPVLQAAERAGLADRFVGSHPMAGGEGSGFGAGRADLFRGARVFLSADRRTAGAQRERAEALWRALEARPIWIGAADHDRLMVKVSQLPQLVANALALVLEQERVDAADLGPGGRDMTRLAQSPPGMWGDLLAHTGADAAALLRSVAARLGELADRLERGDRDGVAELMTRTRAWRAEAQGAARTQGGRR